MLQNSLYKISGKNETSEGKFIFEVELNPDHEIFKGHFPGNPVLPGVCTVQIMQDLLEEIESVPLQMTKANIIKYLSFINPQVNKTILFSVIAKTDPSGVISCNSTAYFETTNFCSFKGEFKKV